MFTDSDRPYLQPHPGGDVHGSSRAGRLLQWGEATSDKDKRHCLFSSHNVANTSIFIRHLLCVHLFRCNTQCLSIHCCYFLKQVFYGASLYINMIMKPRLNATEAIKSRMGGVEVS